jgi:hypothetical protein
MIDTSNLTDAEGNDWSVLHCGILRRDCIKEAIKDPTWQYTRNVMKGLPITNKWNLCRDYLKIMHNSQMARIAVTNYVNALMRAGLVFERIS